MHNKLYMQKFTKQINTSYNLFLMSTKPAKISWASFHLCRCVTSVEVKNNTEFNKLGTT